MIHTWKALLTPGGQRLLSLVEEEETLTPALLAGLRRDHPRELVEAAVQLAAARRKAVGKLPDPGRLLLDPTGVEQATPWPVAEHKSRRFARLGASRAVDLCCGVGADAMALIGAVDTLLAIDIDPLRAWMTARNAGCAAAAADVADLATRGLPFHLDPSRRRGSRRLWRYADYLPGPAQIERIIADSPAGAVKLGPGVDLEALPPGEVELISLQGRLVQAVLWTGQLAEGSIRATCLPAGATLAGPPAELPLGPPRGHLLTVDPAVERAGLLGRLARELGLVAIHPALGLLTADEAVASPWLVPFELLAEMPWRLKRVRRWLTEHDAGPVEVKTRGGAVDPQEARRQLRGAGSAPYTLFVMRLGRRRVCYVTRRPDGYSPPSPPSSLT